ncbi:MAG TPA: cation diffusion facilitator family transporter [Ignavibacteriaceae bacterium]|nr:cation diffusion facilitator family transporter [Ignavibacteriaceae bacterium]
MPSELSLKKRAAYISLAIGIGMFLSKMGAFLITGSAAIFSDAAESVVHVLATSMALYSIILASRPADDSHLYGHGNIEFFSAGVEGLLIVIAAIFIIYTAIIDIIKGSNLKQLDIGVFIISGAGIINLFLGFYLMRMGKKTNSITLVADGKHVLTDAYTSIGVIVGIIIVMLTGLQIIDPLFAIAVALNILFTGYKLIRESIGGLMNETDKEILDKIVEILNSIRREYWIDIHWLRFWKSGDKVFVDFHLTLPYYFTIKESHTEEEFIEEQLESQIPNTEIRIHLDYCTEHLCKYCNYLKCEVRSEDKTERNTWDTEKLIGEPLTPRHHIS